VLSTRAARLAVASGIKGERRRSEAVAVVGGSGEPVGPKNDDIRIGGEVVPGGGDRGECRDQVEENEGIL
jgi:hypothetical protein